MVKYLRLTVHVWLIWIIEKFKVKYKFCNKLSSNASKLWFEIRNNYNETFACSVVSTNIYTHSRKLFNVLKFTKHKNKWFSLYRINPINHTNSNRIVLHFKCFKTEDTSNASEWKKVGDWNVHDWHSNNHRRFSWNNKEHIHHGVNVACN